ncbi:MAG: hypothetical protein J6C82_05065 [Clostridia bacterium]|nr:hypothetical protein [Clostridia bacterium]
MKKPNNYDNTQSYGEFEPLELGGHICRIIKVEECISSTDKAMIRIYIDIAEGNQKDYYLKQYEADTREQKKWGCIVYQLVEDNEGNTNKGFKTFITAVGKSNSTFDESKIWDESFCTYFKNKLVGGVFGREQYQNQKGELKWAIKCVQFRDIETIKKGVEVPEDKYLADGGPMFSMPESPIQGYNVDDDDLPF